ncbi:hypothetical protein [Pseudothauera lacus]|uniref:Lipoprotein n=1 Tax=Pseudothauera lacus TaxID=2136175 RepID=A0A2T4IGU6_9RHOO|nr:hypothetical protein [Pseudothauera lacus]PTD96995.1 hypothetical protein C8261_06260 [Pseudothauera lacus]
MIEHRKLKALPLALLSAFVLSACVSNPFKADSAEGGDSAAKPASTSTSSSSARSSASAIPPGMNAAGEVVDSSQIEAGHGQQVKGINDWEGEITGKPFPGSKFTQLKIGMPMRQVMDLIGQPSDQGSYVTAKAWIPFYFGSDRYRHELIYKGQGRLIFSGGSVGDWSSGHLTWIIYNKNEPAYR